MVESAIIYPSTNSLNVCIYPTPLYKQDIKQGQFLSKIQQVWIQFSF